MGDWRLDNAEKRLYGATLEQRRFSAPTPDWDHEHCRLCWAKFAEWEADDVLNEGYVLDFERSAEFNSEDERTTSFPEEGVRMVGSPTEETWICGTCFEDFKDHFQWSAIDCR
jgi:hypothetical protein